MVGPLIGLNGRGNDLSGPLGGPWCGRCSGTHPAEASKWTHSESGWPTPNAGVHEGQGGWHRKCDQHRIYRGIDVDYHLYELRTKSEAEVAIGRCDAEGSDRLAHGELPLRLVKDQNRPPYAQIRLEGTR